MHYCKKTKYDHIIYQDVLIKKKRNLTKKKNDRLQNDQNFSKFFSILKGIQFLQNGIIFFSKCSQFQRNSNLKIR